MGVIIVEAIREELSELQKMQKATPGCERKKSKQKALEDLTAEFRVKRDTILRQAVHAEPALVERRRGENPILLLSVNGSLNTDSAIEAYQKGGMVKPQTSTVSSPRNSVRTLLAPVVEVYEDEKARILGNVG